MEDNQGPARSNVEENEEQSATFQSLGENFTEYSGVPYGSSTLFSSYLHHSAVTGAAPETPQSVVITSDATKVNQHATVTPLPYSAYFHLCNPSAGITPFNLRASYEASGQSASLPVSTVSMEQCAITPQTINPLVNLFASNEVYSHLSGALNAPNFSSPVPFCYPYPQMYPGWFPLGNGCPPHENVPRIEEQMLSTPATAHETSIKNSTTQQNINMPHTSEPRDATSKDATDCETRVHPMTAGVEILSCEREPSILSVLSISNSEVSDIATSSNGFNADGSTLCDSMAHDDHPSVASLPDAENWRQQYPGTTVLQHSGFEYPALRNTLKKMPGEVSAETFLANTANVSERENAFFQQWLQEERRTVLRDEPTPKKMNSLTVNQVSPNQKTIRVFFRGSPVFWGKIKNWDIIHKKCDSCFKNPGLKSGAKNLCAAVLKGFQGIAIVLPHQVSPVTIPKHSYIPCVVDAAQLDCLTTIIDQDISMTKAMWQFHKVNTSYQSPPLPGDSKSPHYKPVHLQFLERLASSFRSSGLASSLNHVGKCGKMDDKTASISDDLCNVYEFEIKAIIDHLPAYLPADPTLLKPIFLQHLPSSVLSLLASAFTDSLRTAYFSNEWRKTTLIPIVRETQNPKDILSYRFVSVSSLASRLIETAVRSRLEYQLRRTSKYSIPPLSFHQFFYRSHLKSDIFLRHFLYSLLGHRGSDSCEQSAPRPSELVKSLPPSNYARLVVSIRLHRVVEVISPHKIDTILCQKGVSPCIRRWIIEFMNQRRYNVWADRLSSDVFSPTGIPRDSVLNEILSCAVVDELLDELKKFTVEFSSLSTVESNLFSREFCTAGNNVWSCPFIASQEAMDGFTVDFMSCRDDLALWVVGSSPYAAVCCIQAMMETIASWAKKNGVRIDRRAKALWIFPWKTYDPTIYPSDSLLLKVTDKIRLKLRSPKDALESKSNICALGLWIDSLLTFKPHVDKVIRATDEILNDIQQADLKSLSKEKKSAILESTVDVLFSHGLPVFWNFLSGTYQVKVVDLLEKIKTVRSFDAATSKNSSARNHSVRELSFEISEMQSRQNLFLRELPLEERQYFFLSERTVLNDDSPAPQRRKLEAVSVPSPNLSPLIPDPPYSAILERLSASNILFLSEKIDGRKVRENDTVSLSELLKANDARLSSTTSDVDVWIEGIQIPGEYRGSSFSIVADGVKMEQKVNLPEVSTSIPGGVTLRALEVLKDKYSTSAKPISVRFIVNTLNFFNSIQMLLGGTADEELWSVWKLLASIPIKKIHWIYLFSSNQSLRCKPFMDDPAVPSWYCKAFQTSTVKKGEINVNEDETDEPKHATAKELRKRQRL